MAGVSGRDATATEADAPQPRSAESVQLPASSLFSLAGVSAPASEQPLHPAAPPSSSLMEGMNVPSSRTPKSGNAARSASLAAWRDRKPVPNFDRMSQQAFHRFSMTHRGRALVRESQLGPASMKHPSWGDSDTASGLTAPLLGMSTLAILLAVGVGLGVGFGVAQYQWGLGSGAIVLGVCYLVLMTALILYMVKYSGGLKTEHMPQCVDRLGFVTNVRANVLCRYHMTCCLSGRCNGGIFGIIMDGEASEALHRIKQIDDGAGPAAGGVCWLGDSEYTFWHHLREDMASYHPNSFNAGFGGARLGDLQNHLGTLCLAWDPEVVIVHAGGNDFDVNPSLRAGDMPPKLLQVFEAIAAHPSVKRIGYMLSSRRPCYSDWKWEFMVRVHRLTIEAIERSPLRGKVFVLDLRGMVHPLDEFVTADRQHLNKQGHARKARELIAMLRGKRTSVRGSVADIGDGHMAGVLELDEGLPTDPADSVAGGDKVAGPVDNGRPYITICLAEPQADPPEVSEEQV